MNSNKLLVSVLLFLFAGNCWCQSPGGVGTPTFWEKATNGTSTTTNNAVNTSWVSQGSVAATLSQATGANQPLFRNGSGLALPIASSDNIFNYTPYLFFDGTNDCLFSTTSYNFGSSTTGVTEFGVVRPESGIVFFEWNGPNAMIKCKSDGNQALTDGSGSLGTNNQYAMPNNTLPKIQHLSGMSSGLINATGTGNAYSGYNHILVPTLSSNNNPSGSNADRTNVGCNVNTGEFTRGGIAEVIVYNRVLTETELLRVNSYLSVKHGIMLGSPGSVTNYLRADGTTIWNSVAAYHNKVIGIGRDDNSALNQKQSHQDDDTVRIYLSSLAATNAANAGSFASNGAFIMLGSNTGQLCATAASGAEMPAGLTNCNLYSRLAREWMVQRTNSTETFSMDIKLAGCGVPASVNVADLRLLVDDDGNFANGGTQCYYNGDGTGVVFSYSNPVITVSAISTTHIPNNGVKYITIASINPATPLPVQLLSFIATAEETERIVDLNWQTQTEINSNYFIVEHSADMENWKKIATVPAAGNSSHVLDYSVQHNEPVIGTNYYRLKVVDLDGTEQFKQVRSVDFKWDNEVMVYPNPTKGELHINGLSARNADFKLMDNTGRVILCTPIQIDEHHYLLSLSGLDFGVYYLQVITDNGMEVYKINYIF